MLEAYEVPVEGRVWWGGGAGKEGVLGRTRETLEWNDGQLTRQNYS